MKRVAIFDVDPANPYGRELAALVGSEFEVEAFLAVDTEWLPEGIKTHHILPANSPSSLAKQLLRQEHGLVRIARTALIRRTTILVVLTRRWYDQLALALFAALGARIIVIAHDPVPKQALSKFLHPAPALADSGGTGHAFSPIGGRV